VIHIDHMLTSLLALVVLIDPLPVLAQKRRSAGIELRVVSWNIQNGKGGLTAVASVLRKLRADVVALQEVVLPGRRGKTNQATRLARSLGLHQRSCAHRYRGGRVGVALLSRHRITRVRCLSAPRSRLRFLVADVRRGRQRVRLISIHLHPTHPLDPSARKKRMDRLRLTEARAVLRVASRPGMPVVVAGDFNDDTGSPPYKLFQGRFQDACGKAGGLYEKTWPSVLPVTRIDYVWAASKIKVRRCRAPLVRVSDHLPVVADLTLF